jgi:hypothetical protein
MHFALKELRETTGVAIPEDSKLMKRRIALVLHQKFITGFPS